MNDNLSIKDMFPTRFLSSSDLDDTGLVLTIDHVTVEELGRDDRKELKAIVYFREIKKGLVLNKTNATTIAALYGDQTSRWVGKNIALFLTEVSFEGRQSFGIRVRLRPPAAPPQSNSFIPEPPEPPDPWS